MTSNRGVARYEGRAWAGNCSSENWRLVGTVRKVEFNLSQLRRAIRQARWKLVLGEFALAKEFLDKAGNQPFVNNCLEHGRIQTSS